VCNPRGILMMMITVIGLGWTGGWLTSMADNRNFNVLKWLISIATLGWVILLGLYAHLKCDNFRHVIVFVEPDSPWPTCRSEPHGSTSTAPRAEGLCRMADCRLLSTGSRETSNPPAAPLRAPLVQQLCVGATNLPP
jgi:hypothetical protein